MSFRYAGSRIACIDGAQRGGGRSALRFPLVKILSLAITKKGKIIAHLRCAIIVDRGDWISELSRI